MSPEQMTYAEAEAEYQRIAGFRSPSSADMRRMNRCLARMRALEMEDAA